MTAHQDKESPHFPRSTFNVATDPEWANFTIDVGRQIPAVESTPRRTCATPPPAGADPAKHEPTLVPTGEIHTFKLTVEPKYIDSNGHVNNAAYQTLLEEARWDWMIQSGVTREMLNRKKLGPVVLEFNPLTFLKELRAGDEVTIESKLLDFERKVGHIEQIIKRDGEPCCRAVLAWGVMDLEKRKLVLPDAEMLAVLRGSPQPTQP